MFIIKKKEKKTYDKMPYSAIKEILNSRESVAVILVKAHTTNYVELTSMEPPMRM